MLLSAIFAVLAFLGFLLALVVLLDGAWLEGLLVMPSGCPRCGFTLEEQSALDDLLVQGCWYAETSPGRYQCRRCGTRYKEWPNGTFGPDP